MRGVVANDRTCECCAEGGTVSQALCFVSGLQQAIVEFRLNGG